MKDKLKKAIRNNNDLYEAVFSPQQLQSNRNDSIWYCFDKTPPLYSNLVTVCEEWKPDDIFRAIDANFKKENWGEWSIKDSFSNLDLREYGFEKLFVAKWIYLEAERFKSMKMDDKLIYKIVESADVLSDWRIAWDADEKLGKQIFHAELLDNPKVFFIAGYDKETIMSGCFINKTADVLGISNFFAPNENARYWSGMIEFVFDSIKVADIVGYERKNLAEKFQSLGFETIGNLTVWLKSSKSLANDSFN